MTVISALCPRRGRLNSRQPGIRHPGSGQPARPEPLQQGQCGGAGEVAAGVVADVLGCGPGLGEGDHQRSSPPRVHVRGSVLVSRRGCFHSGTSGRVSTSPSGLPGAAWASRVIRTIRPSAQTPLAASTPGTVVPGGVPGHGTGLSSGGTLAGAVAGLAVPGAGVGWVVMPG